MVVLLVLAIQHPWASSPELFFAASDLAPTLGRVPCLAEVLSQFESFQSSTDRERMWKEKLFHAQVIWNSLSLSLS